MAKSRRTRVPTALLLALGLVLGFGLAEATGLRWLGGLVMLAANLLAIPAWLAAGGTRLAVALTVVFWACMVLSHPLAHQIGTWPSVLTVALVAAAAAWLLADRRPALSRARSGPSATTSR
jgi:hypothetical protein